MTTPGFRRFSRFGSNRPSEPAHRSAVRGRYVRHSVRVGRPGTDENDALPAPAHPSGSALVIPLPAVDAVVGTWREALDPSAADGVPAHVTIHFPWVDKEAIDQVVLRDLQEMVAATAPFEVVFRRVGWFGREVLWLDPDPKEPFVTLAAESARRWPDYPQYEGRHVDLVPHVTVGFGPQDRLDAVAADLDKLLPVKDVVTHVWWITRSEPQSWVVRRVLELG